MTAVKNFSVGDGNLRSEEDTYKAPHTPLSPGGEREAQW